MKKLLQTFIALSSLFMNFVAIADFLKDRGYANIGRLNTPVSRLFVGKWQSNECLGSTVSQCVNRPGPYESTEDISENGARIRFYGEKTFT